MANNNNQDTGQSVQQGARGAENAGRAARQAQNNYKKRKNSNSAKNGYGSKKPRGRNSEKAVKGLPGGHAKAAGGAAKGAKAAAKGALKAAGKAAAGFIAALGSSAGPVIVIIAIVMLLIFVVPSLVISTPQLLWNTITHIDTNIDPIDDEDIETLKDDKAVKEKEEHYAEIVSSHLTDSHDAVYDRIKEECKKNGVDYDATQPNIVDSTDFLGSDQASEMNKEYQILQSVYERLKRKGWSNNAAASAMGAASYLTSGDTEYGLNTVTAGGFATLKEMSQSGLGIFKADSADFIKYIKKTYNLKDSDAEKIKDKAGNPEVCADYFAEQIKKNTGKKEYKAFMKEKDLKMAATTICTAYKPLGSDATKSVYSISETLKRKHLIDQQEAPSASSNSNSNNADGSVETTDSSAQNRAASALTKVTQKSGYGQVAASINVNKAAAEQVFKKHEKDLKNTYKGLIEGGLSPAAASSILGNAYGETTWNTTVLSKDGRQSQGICQWTDDRKVAMKQWIQNHGHNWTDFEWQGRYAVYEIKSGMEKNSFAGHKNNVATYGTGFWATQPVGNFAGFAACDDPLQATVNYCACIERCVPGKSNMEKRYAGTMVIMEKCAGITGSGDSGDPYNTGAGSRQMALILSAFSAKEGQLLPTFNEDDGSSDSSSSESSGSGTAVSGGAQKAVEWAKKIAADDSYQYITGLGKCYFCRNKKSPKGFVCTTFVRAAYAHGAKDKDVEKKMCKPELGGMAGKPFETALMNTGKFESLGKIPVSKMKPGDILSISSHAGMYAGDGKTIEAHNPQIGITYSSRTNLLGGNANVFRYKGGGGADSSDVIDSGGDEAREKNLVEKLGNRIVGGVKRKFLKATVYAKMFEESPHKFKIGAKIFKEVLFPRDPEDDLNKALENSEDALYEVTYGDIVTNDDGKRVYADVEVRPASAETIITSVFKLNPKDTWKDVNDEPIVSKNTTIMDITTTMADNHMELLYGNHQYGSGDGSVDSGASGGGELGFPLPGGSGWSIVSEFGKRTPQRNANGTYGSSNHGGVDLAVATGTPIYAADNGTVELAGANGGYGGCVIIKHGNGMETVYGHMSQVEAKKGQKVKRGDEIGKVGMTGNASGPHLHFEVRINGKQVNPKPFIVNYPGLKPRA